MPGGSPLVKGVMSASVVASSTTSAAGIPVRDRRGTLCEDYAMDQRDEMDRSRAEEVGDELAIRKAERRMAREERDMERRMKEFEDAEERAEKQIDEELRREHWEHEPERPPVWPSRGE